MTTTTYPFRRSALPSVRASALSDVTPNWFAAVMGTGVVAVGAAVVPLHLPGLRVLALVTWFLSSAVLVVLGVMTALHHRRYPQAARGHLTHPVIGQFYGAPPMALLTVGTATLLVGRDVLGLPVAIGVDAVLWVIGTLAGLACAVVVPRAQRRRHGATPPVVFAGLLMPVVPPMVSASAGVLLAPHLPAGAVRAGLLLICLVCFVVSLVASALVLRRVVPQMLRHGVGAAATVPTLWIVLGPLGQSATAAHLLAAAAQPVVPAPVAVVAQVLAVAYSVPVLLAAAGWAVLAAIATGRELRRGLPFALTWWSFTFPVGTCVTGCAGLAAHLHSAVLGDVSVALFAALGALWTVVGVRTVLGLRTPLARAISRPGAAVR